MPSRAYIRTRKLAPEIVPTFFAQKRNQQKCFGWDQRVCVGGDGDISFLKIKYKLILTNGFSAQYLHTA